MTKTTKRKLLVPLWVLGVASMACNLAATAPAEAVPSPTADTRDAVTSEEATATTLPPEVPPTATEHDVGAVAVVTITDTPAPTLAPGNQPDIDFDNAEVLYETTFSSGWPEVDTEQSKSQVTDEGYVIEVDKEWAHWVYTTQARVASFYAEVTASVASCGDDGNGFGIMFQYQDSSNFRLLYITCAGAYTAQEVVGGEYSTLLRGTVSDERLDDGEHQISVLATADDNTMLTFFVDRIAIGEVSVESQTEGDIGPYVTTGDVGMSVIFKNLLVLEP